MKWISVKDRLPENDDDVLVYVERRDEMYVDWYDEKYQAWDTHYLDVTHWMPLPEPPEKPYEEWDRISKERRNGGSDTE